MADVSGSSALSVVVGDFYDRVLSDPQLHAFFADVDMPRLRRHQTRFLLLALRLGRGRHEDDRELGERLQRHHGDLGIADADFTRLAAHLGDALLAGGTSPVELSESMARVEAFRSYVVAAAS